jgi:hypothetical protein
MPRAAGWHCILRATAKTWVNDPNKKFGVIARKNTPNVIWSDPEIIEMHPGEKVLRPTLAPPKEPGQAAPYATLRGCFAKPNRWLAPRKTSNEKSAFGWLTHGAPRYIIKS